MKKALLMILAAVLCLPVSARAGTSENSSAQDMLIKSEVETAVSMLQGIADKQAQGEMSLEQAKNLGAALLRNLSYGKNGYFWADTNDGVNVVLYGRKDTEGRNRIGDKDPAGVYYVKEFLSKAKSGGGYVEYLFTQKGHSEPQAKRSYVLPFAPFGWVIGTGYYPAVVAREEATSSADALPSAATRLEAGIVNVLDGLGNTISLVAEETGKIGINSETEIRNLLQQSCNAGRPYVIDSTFIDSKGIMKIIAPDKYRMYEGSDISKQEAVIKMIETKKPRMGNEFVSVEGIRSVDIEHPVFSQGKQFLGSVSMLIKPDDLIRAVAAPIEQELDVKCLVMQKDGLILYESDAAQIGLNSFTDPLYKDYPELIALGRKMIKEEEGKGFYTFRAHGTDHIVKKQTVWKTAHFFNNDWIIATYREVK